MNLLGPNVTNKKQITGSNPASCQAFLLTSECFVQLPRFRYQLAPTFPSHDLTERSADLRQLFPDAMPAWYSAGQPTHNHKLPHPHYAFEPGTQFSYSKHWLRDTGRCPFPRTRSKLRPVRFKIYLRTPRHDPYSFRSGSSDRAALKFFHAGTTCLFRAHLRHRSIISLAALTPRFPSPP
jgi:hypothetical protein